MDKIFKLKDPHLKKMADTGCWPRRKIWNILENPSETTLGRAWYYFSGIMIALSIVCTVAESMPLPCDEKYLCANHTCGKNNWNLSHKENDSCYEINHYRREIDLIYFVLESICVAIFSLEYLMRFLTTPSRCKYVKEFMSIIDLLSILPYYIGLILKSLLQTSVDSLSALVLLRVLRVFRVLKFTRHSNRLRSLLFAIRRSASELGFILFSFSLGVILFSSILFYAEQSDKSNSANQFKSIPATMWYAVVTMTTTG